MDPAEDADAQDTLAGASGQALGKFLQTRRGKAKQNKAAQSLLAARENGVLPQALENAASQDGICGAPAGIADDEQQPEKQARGSELQHGGHELERRESFNLLPKAAELLDTTPRSGRSRVEDAAAASVNFLTQCYNTEDLNNEEWEAASDFEGFFEVNEGAPDPHSGLVISLDPANTAGSESLAQKGRRKFSKEEILAAALVHQAHLLCLLARGQMYDLAAADSLVQGAALSTVPLELLQQIEAAAAHLKADQLRSLVSWFQRTFTLKDDPSAPDEIAVKADEEGGVAFAVRTLQTVVLEKRGSVEEIVTLFVAALRAAGLLVRFVRALDPLHWRPSAQERHVPARPQKRNAPAEKQSASKRPKNSASESNAASSSRKRKAVSSEAAENAHGKEGSDSEKDLPKTTAGRGRGRGRGGKGKVSKQQLKADEDQEPEGASGQLHEGQKEVKPEEGLQSAQRKGDLEFENQIAMAIMASGEPSKKPPTDPTTSSGPSDAKKFKALLKGEAEGRQSLGSSWRRSGVQNQAADSWAEVYCGGEEGGEGRWVQVNPLLGWVDQPELVETSSVRHAQLAYVVAFGGGGAKDVTSRYVSNLQAAEKLKKPNAGWWTKTLKPLRALEVEATKSHLAAQVQPAGLHAPGSSGKAAASAKGLGSASSLPSFAAKSGPRAFAKLKDEVKARAKREDQELKQRVERQQQVVPTTLEGFKDCCTRSNLGGKAERIESSTCRSHKNLILQRHILRYNAIRPGATKVGLHKGEPYFQASDVSELHTAEKWVALGREVAEAELEKPFKVVAKRGSKRKAAEAKDAGEAAEQDEEEGPKPQKAEANSSNALPEDESLHTKLYGEWQTQPWQVPVAEDGIVPKNERGTVHCPPLAFSLPKGTMQIDLPRVVSTCKRLEVDYAMAMTGFDIRGGRSIPRFEGVVVCTEFGELVQAEWAEEQRELAEKAAFKQIEEARKTWAALLKAMFTRLGLQNQHQKSPKGKKSNKKSQLPDEAADREASDEAPEDSKRRGKSQAGRKRSGKGKKEENQDAQKDTNWNSGAAAEFEEI